MRSIGAPTAAPAATRDIPFLAAVEPGETVAVALNAGADVPTGPLEIVGARPGDALAVAIRELRIGPGCKSAGVAERSGVGLLGHELSGLGRRGARELPIVDGRLQLNDELAIPVRPALGLIEVFPLGEPLSVPLARSHWPWRYGGRLGSAIVPGCTVYLPVAAPGAGLFVGDPQAAASATPILTRGASVPGEAVLTVGLRSDLELTWPIVETSDEIILLASARTMGEAGRIALEALAELMAARLSLKFEEAGMLLSLAGDLRIGQAIETQVTMLAAVPKAIASELRV